MPFWAHLLLTIVMGMAGVGMNVMHDGNHGSYSNKTGLKIHGRNFYLHRRKCTNWQVQHNVLHHTYTNIPGHDEDLDAGRIIDLQKMQNGILSIAFNITLYFYMVY
jgi:linoleoyl-CoA desaturase